MHILNAIAFVIGWAWLVVVALCFIGVIMTFGGLPRIRRRVRPAPPRLVR